MTHFGGVLYLSSADEHSRIPALGFGSLFEGRKDVERIPSCALILRALMHCQYTKKNLTWSHKIEKLEKLT